MTTFESTVSIMEQLPEADLKIINDLALHLLTRTAKEGPFRPLTEAEWLDKLDTARRHADEGRVLDAREVGAALRQKYERR